MKDDDDIITNRMLLEHMQAHKYELQLDIKELKKDIHVLSVRIEKVEFGFGDLQKDVRSIKNALQRLYDRRIEMVQRLDHIEEKELPAIKKYVGMTS